MPRIPLVRARIYAQRYEVQVGCTIEVGSTRLDKSEALKVGQELADKLNSALEGYNFRVLRVTPLKRKR